MYFVVISTILSAALSYRFSWAVVLRLLFASNSQMEKCSKSVSTRMNFYKTQNYLAFERSLKWKNIILMSMAHFHVQQAASTCLPNESEMKRYRWADFLAQIQNEKFQFRNTILVENENESGLKRRAYELKSSKIIFPSGINFWTKFDFKSFRQYLIEANCNLQKPDSCHNASRHDRSQNLLNKILAWHLKALCATVCDSLGWQTQTEDHITRKCYPNISLKAFITFYWIKLLGRQPVSTIWRFAET